MARRGQVGTITVSGKWYVVRFWKYPVGRDRIRASERICPINNKATGFLSKGERRRRANEIVAASGVNDKQAFVETHVRTTFRPQAEEFLKHSMTRKRNPIKPATISGWSSCFDKWLNPNLGELPLASINNQSVKTLVAKMHTTGLSAKTILNYVGLVKLVVASAVSEDGEELFPRKWNHDFLDIPVVENQYQPSFSAETMSAIVEKADGQEQVLYALLAGTGLRIGEALGLEVRHFSIDFRSVTIEQSCWAGKIQSPKTKNALRQIDISSSLTKLLKTFTDRRSGLVFQNRNGKPLSQTNVVRRSLHPILKEIGIEKTGFHAMRRVHATWLRKQRVPEDLIQYWLGHAKQSVTDSYSKLAEDLDFRTQTAEAIGTGFIVPDSLGPMGPRIVKEVEVEIAA